MNANIIQDVFTDIYINNKWRSGVSVSGVGSEVSQTKVLVSRLIDFFEKENIASLLDVPCGDVNWQPYLVDYLCAKGKRFNYIGCDIVAELIDVNNHRFQHADNYSFFHKDITKDLLPKSEFLLVRDCFVHLSDEMVFDALNNIANSDVKFVGITSFTQVENNTNINIGEWRTMNLGKAPYSLKAPYAIINEDCREEFPLYTDKSICIWKIEDIHHLKKNKNKPCTHNL